MFTNIMKLEEAIRNTVKTLSLALLISFGVNNNTDAQFKWLKEQFSSSSSSPKSAAKFYFNAIKNRDLSDFLDIISGVYKERLESPGLIRRNKSLSPQEDAINQLYSHYGSSDITIETYIPQEKKWYGYDKEDIVWANHSGCGYHEILLIKENEKWKIRSIGDYYNSRE